MSDAHLVGTALGVAFIAVMYLAWAYLAHAYDQKARLNAKLAEAESMLHEATNDQQAEANRCGELEAKNVRLRRRLTLTEEEHRNVERIRAGIYSQPTSILLAVIDRLTAEEEANG